jgi:putative heme-binding domain-containing protein
MEGTWWNMAVVSGIAEGLRQQTADSLPRTISALIAEPPAELAGSLRGLGLVVASVSATLQDRTRPVADRVAALSLLEHLPKRDAAALIGPLLSSREPVEIQQAVLEIIGRLDRGAVTPILYRNLGEMGSVARTSAMQYLQRNPLELLHRIKAGDLNPALVDAASRWGILNSSKEEVRALGQEVFGRTAGDRKALVRRYATAIAGQTASPERGREVFTQSCAVCHRFRGDGNDVGPDISDVRIKTPEMLLSDILDPNNSFEPQWEAYSVRTRDGRTLVGMMAFESNDAIVLKSITGSETISRAALEAGEPLGISLMPPGLEATLSEDRMADLLAYLRSEMEPTARPSTSL